MIDDDDLNWRPPCLTQSKWEFPGPIKPSGKELKHEEI